MNVVQIIGGSPDNFILEESNILFIPGLEDPKIKDGHQFNNIINKLEKDNVNIKILKYTEANNLNELVKNANKIIKTGKWLVVGHSAGCIVARKLDTTNIDYMILIDPTPSYAIKNNTENEGIISWFKEEHIGNLDNYNIPIEVHYNVNDGKDKDLLKETDILEQFPNAIRHSNKSHWIWKEDINSIYNAITAQILKKSKYGGNKTKKIYDIKANNVLGHIAGTSGSGKTFIGEYIHKKYPDIITKDLDEFVLDIDLAKVKATNKYTYKWDLMIKRINKFIENNKNNKIIFVGYNHEDIHWINFPGFKWFLNTPIDITIERRIPRDRKCGFEPDADIILMWIKEYRQDLQIYKKRGYLFIQQNDVDKLLKKYI